MHARGTSRLSSENLGRATDQTAPVKDGLKRSCNTFVEFEKVAHDELHGWTLACQRYIDNLELAGRGFARDFCALCLRDELIEGQASTVDTDDPVPCLG